MNTQKPCAQFFEGVPEEIDGVSLRRDKATHSYIAVLKFEKLAALERLRSFWKTSKNALHLLDEEGEILIKPSGIQFMYGGEEGEDLKQVNCTLEIDREEHWQRFMRFMHRYAEANGLTYGGKSSQ